MSSLSKLKKLLPNMEEEKIDALYNCARQMTIANDNDDELQEEETVVTRRPRSSKRMVEDEEVQKPTGGAKRGPKPKATSEKVATRSTVNGTAGLSGKELLAYATDKLKFEASAIKKFAGGDVNAAIKRVDKAAKMSEDKLMAMAAKNQVEILKARGRASEETKKQRIAVQIFNAGHLR